MIPVKENESEHMHQVRLVSWFRRTYPCHLIFAIPNGGRRNKSEAARLKAEGVTAGVPDIFIPVCRLFIEMKKPGGKVSEEQDEVIGALEGSGYTVHVCYGFEEARAVVKEEMCGI